MGLFPKIADALTFSLILQGVGLSVLAIFAPLVIGTLVSYLDENKKSLERRIILTGVLSKWPFLVAIVVLLTLPLVMLIFREYFEATIVLLCLWGFAVGYFLLKINKFYEWLSGKDGILLEYFGSPMRLQSWRQRVKIFFSREVLVINLEEKVKSWENLWNLNFSEHDYPRDEEFFARFVKDVDSLLHSKKENELNSLHQLISDFSSNIQKRSRSIFASDEFLPKILEWYYRVVQLDNAVKYGKLREIIEQIESKIDELAERVTSEAVKKSEHRKQFLEVISRCEPKYLELFSFFNLLDATANLEFRDMRKILEDEIPPTWETIKLKVDDYLLEQALLWFELMWRGIDHEGEVRASKKSSKFATRNVDRICRMNAVARSLFTKSTPVKLVRLLGIRHSISQYSPLAMTNAYQLEGIFYEDRLMPVGVKIREELNEERLNWTVDFILNVYPRYFTLEKLQVWQRELENFDTQSTDQDESLGRDAWLEIIGAMIKRLNEPNAEVDNADEQADSSAEQTD